VLVAKDNGRGDDQITFGTLYSPDAAHSASPKSSRMRLQAATFGFVQQIGRAKRGTSALFCATFVTSRRFVNSRRRCRRTGNCDFVYWGLWVCYDKFATCS
jgi:hypothetical protein